MPGQFQHTVESLVKEARDIAGRGVTAFVLFGVPVRKDPEGSEAWNASGIAQPGALGRRFSRTRPVTHAAIVSARKQSTG